MTTKSDDLDKRIANLGAGREDTEGVPVEDGFNDASGEYPKRENFFASSINQAALGGKVNELYTGGGGYGAKFDFPEQKASEYPFNQVQETQSGHVVELDDTPGGERVLIKHRTGSGIELRADGSAIFSSPKHKVEISGGDNNVIVEGEANLVYKGNLNVHVSGDYNLTVGGSYNIDVYGNKSEEIHLNDFTTIDGNQNIVVKESQSTTTGANRTLLVLGKETINIKDTSEKYVKNNLDLHSGKQFLTSGAGEWSASSQVITIQGAEASLLGETGIVGGMHMHHFGNVFYGYDDGTGGTLQSPEAKGTRFFGSLVGQAEEAIWSKRAQKSEKATEAAYATTAGQAALGTPVVRTGEEHTFKYQFNNQSPEKNPVPISVPTLIATTGFYGIKNILIDDNGEVTNAIKKLGQYGNIIDKKPTIAEVRSRMRHASSNSTFTSKCQQDGTLSTEFRLKAPPTNRFNIGRVASKAPSSRFGYTPLGNNALENRSKRFKL